MRLSFVGRTCAIGGLFLSFASIASAVPQVAPARIGVQPTGDLNSVTINDTYTMYSGVGNAANGNLYLIENTTTPTADDRVTFNFVPEVINNYSTTPPVVRNVNESDISLGGSLRKMTISIFTTQGSDLWPSGFLDPTTNAPLTAGGFGIGFVLPPSVNGGSGGEGLAWNGDLITQADMDIFDTTGLEAGNTGPLPLNVFFNSTTAWDGTFGVIFTDDTRPEGVTNAGVYRIDLNVTYQVPEPTTAIACLLPLGGLVLRRRAR
jgi:hypothetical protein